MEPGFVLMFVVIGVMALVVVVGRLLRGPGTPERDAKDRRTRGNAAGWNANNDNL